MDFIADLLNGPIGIPLIAMVTAALVQLYKRWTVRKEGEWWYQASIITTAFLIAFLWSIAAHFANREALDWPVTVRLLFQGVLIGMLASGGYEWIKQAWEFIGGVRGNSITIGDIDDSDNIAIGGGAGVNDIE